MTYVFQLDHSPAQAVAYYIQLSTYQAENLFSVDGEGSRLNLIGQIAADEWLRTASSHLKIALDQWVIVPNGLEALVMVKDRDLVVESKSFGRSLTKPRVLSSFIATFKAAAAKRINLVRGQPGLPVWQRSYQEQRLVTEQSLIQRRQKLLSGAGIIWTVPSLID